MSSQPATNSSSNGVAAGHLGFEKPLLRIENEIVTLENEQRTTGRDMSVDIKAMRTRLTKMTKRLYSHLTAWETVQVARHPTRPLVPDYINYFVRDFCELHGDRYFGDDRAMLTGFGRIGPYKVMVIGHNKGKDTNERITCNFGCAHPEGYRKSLRMMKLAEKFNLPVVCLIDTQGAYPGIGAEERGISRAIAVNLMEMSRLRTQVVCVVIGEGGSGGALGIGVGDRVAMFEHSFYSVISPEGCAAILWRTSDERERAAESLKLTAKELKKLDIIDQYLPEPLGGAHRDPKAAARTLETYLVDSLRELRRFKIDTVLRKRYERIRNLGQFFESADAKTRAKAKAKAKAGGGDGSALARGRRTQPRLGRSPTTLAQ
ncbi:MAG: acetyl-CoA carboxylase carboxyltransferase subunit alpha [Phycisphaerae bacterium]|nr:acetyl-CoA carboxylase carboxyltransferase subunit alpha [Phycisphaerae bacterium]